MGPGCNTREIAHKLIELKADIEDLEQQEQELEKQKMWVQQSIKNVTEDVQNNWLAYVTHEDICKCFTGEEMVLRHKDIMLQSCQPIPAAFLSPRKRRQHILAWA